MEHLRGLLNIYFFPCFLYPTFVNLYFGAALCLWHEQCPYNELGGAACLCWCPGGSDEGQIGSHLVDALPLKHLFLTGYGPTDEEYTRNPVIPAAREQRCCIFVVVPYKKEQWCLCIWASLKYTSLKYMPNISCWSEIDSLPFEWEDILNPRLEGWGWGWAGFVIAHSYCFCQSWVAPLLCYLSSLLVD